MNLCLVLSLFASGTAQSPDLKVFDGDWIFVEDRTEGRALEQQTPPMSSKFTLKTEEGVLVLVLGHGGSNRNVRIPLNGAHLELPDTAETTARYSAAWKEGVLSYEVEFVRKQTNTAGTHVKRSFQITRDGLIVRSNLGPTGTVGLYKHPEDIPMPTPIKSVISDLAWLSGNWVGERGTGGSITFEERWSPAKAGSMFATSRTMSRDKLAAFEFLRIIEKDGGLVYVAQPNGGTPTEFVMTEYSATKAVFENPRHDYPKRIMYEVGSDGGLTATIGYIKGGTPRKFVFKKEGE